MAAVASVVVAIGIATVAVAAFPAVMRIFKAPVAAAEVIRMVCIRRSPFPAHLVSLVAFP